MSVFEVLLDEFRNIGARVGGVRGAFVLALLALLATLIPSRAGRGFLEPAYMLAYCSFAVLFASYFVAQSFAGQRERSFIDNPRPAGPSDLNLTAGKVLAGTGWGWLCWALILGVSLATLNAGSRLRLLPAPGELAALSVFALCVSWLASAIAAVVGLFSHTVGAARQLLRLGFLFLLLLAVALPRFLPDGMRESLYGILQPEEFASHLRFASALFLVLGWIFLRLTVRNMADRRISLSITAE